MSDKPNEGAADGGQPQGAAAPSEVSIRVKGTDVMMPLEKLKTLAQQGLNQQHVQEQITADRAALESDTKTYQEYKNLRDHLDANPEVQRAVSRALSDPSSVLNPQPRQTGDDLDGDDQQQPPQVDPKSSQEFADLRRQIAQLQSESQKRDARDATTQQAGAIDSEINSYPWLENEGRAREMARAQIAAHMAATPGADLASTTAVVAQGMRELLEDARTVKANAVPGRRRLQTDPPGRGAPPVTTSKPMTKKSFSDGSMGKALKDMARNFGLDA